jgi:MoxR-like ATPase
LDATQARIDDDELAYAQEKTGRLKKKLGMVVRWKETDITLVIASMLCGGHVLLEGRPGIGKTEFAKALAALVSAEFKRIQCTPDLMPTDITGYQDPRTNEFRKGPVFAEIVLVDELNRAQPRTQSALLEAMAERSVTVDGTTYYLPDGKLTRLPDGKPAPRTRGKSFFVIATQNPIEHRGVNDLPEAQLDRFLLQLTPEEPSEEDERQMLLDRQFGNPADDLEHDPDRLEAADFERLQSIVQRVGVHPVQIINPILRIVRATRQRPELIDLGASPRAALHLMALARSYALVHEGRRFVIDKDLKEIAPHVLSHRIVPAPGMEEVTSTTKMKREVIDAVLESVSFTG